MEQPQPPSPRTRSTHAALIQDSLIRDETLMHKTLLQDALIGTLSGLGELMQTHGALMQEALIRVLVGALAVVVISLRGWNS